VNSQKGHMTRALHHLRHHALATTALLLAILGMGSASYAAFTISGRQIRNHTIDPVKFDPRFIAGSVRGWAVISPSGRLISGGGRPVVTAGGFPGEYTIDWGTGIDRRCATSATVDQIASKPTETITGPTGTGSFVAGYASAASFSYFNHRTKRRAGSTIVEAFNQQGQPAALGIDVVVVC
jgi:hypothetical protein